MSVADRLASDARFWCGLYFASVRVSVVCQRHLYCAPVSYVSSVSFKEKAVKGLEGLLQTQRNAYSAHIWRGRVLSHMGKRRRRGRI